MFASAMTELVLGDNIKTIGDYAFYGCSKLIKVTCDSKLRTIGERAFANCYYLSDLTLNEGLKEIKNEAFWYCMSVSSVTVPKSLQTVGENNPFRACTSLTSMLVASGNKNFTAVDNVLYSIDQKKLISYPAGSSATSFTIPEQVTSIENCAFCNVSALQNVTFNTNVEKIGERAFYSCALQSVAIPASVNSIADAVFMSNKSLTELTVDAANNNYKAENGFLMTKDGTVLLSSIYQNGAMTVPANVTEIRPYTFYQMSGITSATFPSTLRIIGEEAFDTCDNMSAVTFGDSLEEIGGFAFSDCYALKSASFPASFRKFGDNAFDNCTSLSTLELNDGLTTIGISAFKGCSALESVSIPGTVTDWGQTSFYQCLKLKNVDIQEGVESIPVGTFAYSRNLAQLNLPKSLKRIENFAAVSTSLPTLTLPENLEYIGESAFQQTSLTSIKLPDSVTEIDNYAFALDTKMISFEAGSGLKRIGNRAIQGNSLIETIILNEGLETIGELALAFNPELSEITIPSTVTSIGEYMFAGDTALENIYNKAVTPQELNYELFSEDEWNGYEDVILNVPAESIDDYKAANIWKKFSFIVSDNSSIEKLSDDVNEVSAKYFDLSGRQVANPTAGIYVKVTTYSNGKQATEKVAVK